MRSRPVRLRCPHVGVEELRIVDRMAVEDVGRIINPLTLHGQCIGAVGVSGVKSSEDAQVARAGIARRPIAADEMLEGVRNKDTVAVRASKSVRGGYATLRLSSACGVASAAADLLGRSPAGREDFVPRQVRGCPEGGIVSFSEIRNP